MITHTNSGTAVPIQIPPPPDDLVHRFERDAWQFLVAGMMHGFHAPRLKAELVRRKHVCSYGSLSNVALQAEYFSPARGSEIRYGSRLRPEAQALLNRIYSEFC